MTDQFPVQVDQPMTPAEFGEAFTKAMAAGAGPTGVPSGWVEVFYPFDCGGLVPAAAGVDLDKYRHLAEPFLIACGIEQSVVDAAWEWYVSRPRQSC